MARCGRNSGGVRCGPCLLLLGERGVLEGKHSIIIFVWGKRAWRGCGPCLLLLGGGGFLEDQHSIIIFYFGERERVVDTCRGCGPCLLWLGGGCGRVRSLEGQHIINFFLFGELERGACNSMERNGSGRFLHRDREPKDFIALGVSFKPRRLT